MWCVARDRTHHTCIGPIECVSHFDRDIPCFWYICENATHTYTLYAVTSTNLCVNHHHVICVLTSQISMLSTLSSCVHLTSVHPLLPWESPGIQSVNSSQLVHCAITLSASAAAFLSARPLQHLQSPFEWHGVFSQSDVPSYFEILSAFVRFRTHNTSLCPLSVRVKLFTGVQARARPEAPYP